MASVTAAIRELWTASHPDGRFAAAMTRECWRAVYRAKSSIGHTDLSEAPLAQPDRLIDRHGLTPGTEERVFAVAHRAVQELCDAATTEEYVVAQHRVRDALEGIRHLRVLRLGPQSLGLGFRPEPPLRPFPGGPEATGTPDADSV